MQIRQFLAVAVTSTVFSYSVQAVEPYVSFEGSDTRNSQEIIRQTASSLRLDNAVSRTLNNNPQLYQFRFRQQSLEGQGQLAALKPGLQLDVEVENILGSGDLNGLNSAELTVGLSSVIELGDKMSSRIALNRAKSDYLGFEQQAATLDVLGKLTTSYILALSTQESIALVEEAVVLSQRMRNTVENRVTRGAAPEAELMRAEANLSRAKIQLQALKASFERQKVGLSLFWGEINPGFNELRGQLDVFNESADFPSLFDRAKSSPAISIFASEARLKDAEIALVQAQSQMDVGWQVGVRRFQETSDTAFIAGVSVPLFTDKRNQGALASAMAERNAVDYLEKEALLRLHNQLFSAFSQWQENKLTVAQFDENVLPALERALMLTEDAYESGRYRYQDWIIAQEELLTAKQQRLEAATSAQLSQVLIEQLIAEPLQILTTQN